MRILIAPQEFKGTLSAIEAAAAIARGLGGAFPDADLELAPMADGGPGTAAAMLTAAGGKSVAVNAHDPLMRPVAAEFVRLDSGTAVIECAEASGLWRLRPEELDARRATSYGTGELIAAALEQGCRELIIGLGGSASNDGGAGMAQALGFHLLNAKGTELAPGGAALTDLARIDAAEARPEIKAPRILGATDVTNPLCGPTGASAVFGSQKGADAAAVELLDAALSHFADIVARDLGIDVRTRPGAGAAGGLGAGLLAFLGAELRPGAELVAEAIGLREKVLRADVVITGEGRLDGQTAFGKASQYVARLARASGRPVVCLAGSLGSGHESLRTVFDVIEVTGVSGEMPSRDEAMNQVEVAAVRALLRLSERSGVGGR
ncbi:MAG: glycerate kinase [Dehalococcoidia bacterium]|nr:glycerate kinase [Dehalococcoidia bacterium]